MHSDRETHTHTHTHRDINMQYVEKWRLVKGMVKSTTQRDVALIQKGSALTLKQVFHTEFINPKHSDMYL